MSGTEADLRTSGLTALKLKKKSLQAWLQHKGKKEGFQAALYHWKQHMLSLHLSAWEEVVTGTRAQALQLFKLHALRRGWRGLQETVKRQEERLRAVLFWQETTTRHGLQGLCAHVQRQKQQRERLSRALHFHLSKGAEYAKKRVLERLLLLKVRRLDREMAVLKTADIHRKATLRSFLQAMRSWMARGQDLYSQRLAGKALVAFMTFNLRKQRQNSYFTALKKLALRKLFTNWRTEVSNLHEKRMKKLGKLGTKVTFWAFFAWKRKIQRQKRKNYAEFWYEISLKRRLLRNLCTNVTLNLHYAAVIKQLSQTRRINAVSKGFDTWLRGIQCLQVEKWRKRKSKQLYGRNLQVKAVNSLKMTLQSDVWRVYTLIPKRKRLLKRFFILLWRYQASKLAQLLVKSKQFRLVLKKSRLKRLFGLWSDKYHSIAAANRLENRKISQARGLIGSSNLRFCFNAWVERRDLALIQHLKREKARNHYEKKALKERFEEWKVRARVSELERRKKAVCYRKNWQRLVKVILLGLKEHYERRKIRKNVTQVASSFAEKSCLKRHFRFLMQFFRRKQVKNSQKRFALKMRENDLIADSLRRVMTVGFLWRSERLALTYQSREHKDRRVWAVVAKCAEIWKEKALKRRKSEERPEKRRVERTNVKERVMPEAVREERKGNRPPPRRLNSVQTKEMPVIRSKPVPQPPLPASSPSLSAPSKSPEARLMEIEAELVEYKIEKEHLHALEKAAVTPSPVLLALREQCQRRLPRIKALFTELSQLRSLLP